LHARPFPTASGYKDTLRPLPPVFFAQIAIDSDGLDFIDRKKINHLSPAGRSSSRPPHATNRLQPLKYLSTEIRASISLSYLVFSFLIPTSVLSSYLHRYRASHVSVLKNEQRFDCICKDSDAAPIAVSLGKGPAADQQLFSTLAAFPVSCTFPCPVHKCFAFPSPKCIRPGCINKRRRQCSTE